MLALWYVVNASLSSYYKLVRHFGSEQNAINQSAYDWQQLGIHKAHIERLQSLDAVQAFLCAIEKQLAKEHYKLLFKEDDNYPSLLHQIYDPPPVLFYKGNATKLSLPQIAIVGSRKPTVHAQSVSYDLAQYLVQAGFVVTSGLAEGVDTWAHLGALAQTEPDFLGQTIGVMGTGIDVCYPKSNRHLFDDIVDKGGCLVTELLPGTPASKFTFPRRNRLIAGLSLATVVTEATVQSGSLITAKLAAEQGKQIFAIPSRIDNPNAEGCHHLIREGATLIYHPKQIIEDIKNNHVVNALPKRIAKNISNFDENQANTKLEKMTADNQNVPEHLQRVYHKIDKELQDLDALIGLTELQAPELLAQLTELEIYGLIIQNGGRYGKV